MSNEYLLVDGYNIIHAWSELKTIADENLDAARQKLIHILSDYQGYKQINIIIVFDAYNIKDSVTRQYKFNNVDIVYTKEAETADRFIEKTVHRIGKTKRVRVATSDKLEQIIILGKGATRLSARELKEELETLKKKQYQKYESKLPIKNNMLEDNVAPEIKEWMENFRRQ